VLYKTFILSPLRLPFRHTGNCLCFDACCVCGKGGLSAFHFLHFESLQTHVTASAGLVNKGRHGPPIISAKDGRNRKVRGLWKRGDRACAQIRVPGRNSARKIPLPAKPLTEAKVELLDGNI